MAVQLNVIGGVGNHLSPCRWRGYVDAALSRCQCNSPKLITPQGFVPVNLCTGEAWPAGVCKYLDHEPDLRPVAVGAATTGPAPVGADAAPDTFPCVHRGPVIDPARLCDLCSIRGQPFEVYQCGKSDRDGNPLYKECSIGRKHSAVQPCISCDSRCVIPPRLTPQRPAPSCDTILKDNRGRFAPSFHNLYMTPAGGGTAFLIGGGPSLNSMDLAPLRQPGLLLAAMNNIATMIRPHLWFCVDTPTRFSEAVLRDPGVAKFIKDKMAGERVWTWDADEATHRKTKDEAKALPNCWFYQHAKDFDAAQFFIQPYPTWGPRDSRSVMLVAIRMLFWMGVRRIYLLGCDFKMKQQQPYAFDETAPEGIVNGNNSKYKILDKMFKQLLPYCEMYGLQIFNCTPGSRLAAFPHVPYEAAVEDALSQMPEQVVTRGMYRE